MGLLKNIREGWVNYLKASVNYDSLDPEIKEEAERRAKICKECPSLIPSGIYQMIERALPNGGKTTDRVLYDEETHKNIPSDPIRGYKCGECGCAFPANVLAPQKRCPLGKWDIE